MRLLAIDDAPGTGEFLHRRDHREHDPEGPPGRRLQERAELHAQQGRAIEADAYRAPAERRVLLFEGRHVGQDLVAADVEGADRDRQVASGGKDRLVERLLLGGRRHALRHHELQFGAEQPNALGAGLGEMGEVDQQAGVEVKPDADLVAGQGRDVAESPVLSLATGAQAGLLGISRLDLGCGPHLDLAGGAVDDDRIARVAERRGVGDLADRGDAERARDDGDVAGRTAFLQHDAAQVGPLVIEERRRAHGARDEDRVFGHRGDASRLLADEAAQQPVGEVVEIVQAVAQIGVGLAQHPRAVVGLDALDGGFGREA
ncbi:hypothetical protein MMMDOFMJ_4471 [Methylobacterium gnaphalii]|nr:hypothetical protein MMMDOFMJ_4471 [Methylobacterium gnaphalii]